MRRDLEDSSTAIVDADRSLYLLNFPTTGWFGDRTVALVERMLRRGIGRLMTTISIDGPRELHDAMRGLPGSWERGIETLRRLRAIKTPEFSGRRRHDAVREERRVRRRHDRRDPRGHSGFRAHRPPPEYRPRVGALLRQRRLSGRSRHRIRSPTPSRRIGTASATAFIRSDFSKIAIRRSSAATTRRTSRRCRARRSPRRASSIRTGSCIRARSGTSRSAACASRLRSASGCGARNRTRDVRAAVVDEQCPHCWTPCEAYPTILGNLAKAVTAGSGTSRTRTS